jgi:hypothetical protein
MSAEMVPTDKVDKALRVMQELQKMDKGMLQSKKFVGFMLIEITWKVLIAYAIYADMSSTVLLAMVTASGTAETAFLGAQAWHDKHTKTAKMAALNGGVSAAVQGSPDSDADAE